MGKRVVDDSSDFVCLCPYASRFPYEICVLPVRHSSSFERDMATESRLITLAKFLKVNLLRVQKISDRLRLVLHTEPNLLAQGADIDRWKTVRDDFHWHIEIYPELDGDTGHFDAESFYYNPVPAEEAAVVLRGLELAEENLQHES